MKKFISSLLTILLISSCLLLCSCNKMSDNYIENINFKDNNLTFENVTLGKDTLGDIDKKYPDIDLSSMPLVESDSSEPQRIFGFRRMLKMPNEDIECKIIFYFQPFYNDEQGYPMKFDNELEKPSMTLYTQTVEKYDSEKAKQIQNYLVEQFTKKFGTATHTAEQDRWELGEGKYFVVKKMLDTDSSDYYVTASYVIQVGQWTKSNK